MHYVPDMPEKKEKQPLLFCDLCNGDLYVGDVVYKINNDVICEECLGDYFMHTKITLGGL